MSEAYDWDEPPIESPNETNYTLLAPGVYPFEVVKLVRARHPGSAKLDPCNKAIITIVVNGESEVETNLFLHKKCEGLLCVFFRAIGLRKHGDPLVFAWNRIIGLTGWVQIKNRPGTGKYEGKFYNEVDKFIPPENAPKDGQPKVTGALPQQSVPVPTPPVQPVQDDIPYDDDIPF